MIHHSLVTAGFETVPTNEMGRVSGIAAPWIGCEKLLAHEQLGDSWSRQEHSCRESRAAAGAPRSGVQAVGQSGYARVAAGSDDVVIFDAGHGLPGVREIRREKICRDGVEIHRGVLAF